VSVIPINTPATTNLNIGDEFGTESEHYIRPNSVMLYHFRVNFMEVYSVLGKHSELYCVHITAYMCFRLTTFKQTAWKLITKLSMKSCYYSTSALHLITIHKIEL
jgi:hypothetical protein